MQAVLFLLSNFNVYKEINYKNASGLNNMATVFSVIFTVMNSLIASLVNNNERQNYICTVFIFISTVVTLVLSEFNFEEMDDHTILSLSISIIFCCILAPSVVYFS